MRRKRTHQVGSKLSNSSINKTDENLNQQQNPNLNQMKQVEGDVEKERQIKLNVIEEQNKEENDKENLEEDIEDIDEDENDNKLGKEKNSKKKNVYDPKNITPKDMVFINYYRWTFLFFFFHFFSFICATDMVNEFTLYSEEQTTFGDQFPKIKPVLYVYLIFCVLILLYMFIAYKVTYQKTMKQFYIFMAIFVSLYFMKIIFLFLVITIEPDMNEIFSQYYQDITDDNKTDLCSEYDYSICRMTLSWNFFKYQLIFDSVVVTIIFGVYLYFIRKYKIQLIQDLVESVEYKNLAEIPGIKTQNQINQMKEGINVKGEFSISQHNNSQLINNQ